MAAEGASMLRTLNPLLKLFVCLTWLTAAMLVFDTRFQAACILLTSLTLIVFARISPLVLLALMIPFCLFGFGFLTTNLLFHQESDYALRVASESFFASKA